MITGKNLPIAKNTGHVTLKKPKVLNQDINHA
jgi:hypothetical protein